MVLMFEKQISDSLIELSKNCEEGFTGLGIIYYDDLTKLPYIGLHNCKLPENIVNLSLTETLLNISRKSSIYHDGFHFVDSKSLKITHISQYISPSLDVRRYSLILNIIPCGAREMTSLLTSLVDGIVCVGLISSDKTIKIFKNGINIYKQVNE